VIQAVLPPPIPDDEAAASPLHRRRLSHGARAFAQAWRILHGEGDDEELVVCLRSCYEAWARDAMPRRQAVGLWCAARWEAGTNAKRSRRRAARCRRIVVRHRLSPFYRYLALDAARCAARAAAQRDAAPCMDGLCACMAVLAGIGEPTPARLPALTLLPRAS